MDRLVNDKSQNCNQIMRRDNYPEKNNYYGPPYTPQPNTSVSFVSFPKPLPSGKQMPNPSYAQSVYLKNNQFAGQRYSLQPHKFDANNTFLHLRNEITNLRSDFNRLVEPSLQRKQQLNNKPFTYQQRNQKSYSNTGMPRFESNRQMGSFNFKNKITEANMTEQLDQQNKFKTFREEQPVGRLQKRFSTQHINRVPDRSLYDRLDSNGQGTTLDVLSKQIHVLNERNRRADDQIRDLKRQIDKKDSQFADRTMRLAKDLQQNKTINEQLNISLSLKNELVEKLQKQTQKSKVFIAELQKEVAESRQRLDAVQLQYQNQVTDLQAYKLKMQVENEKYHISEQKIQSMSCELALKQELIVQKTKQIEKLKNDPVLSQSQETMKIKQLQDDNAQLRKRVQSYKKTVEQLNISNNVVRDKQLALKEQNRLLKEEARKCREDAKIFCEQIRIKESLITSLYRDINILNNEIRGVMHLKNQLNSLGRYVDELNGQIIVLQCQKLDIKYCEGDD